MKRPFDQYELEERIKKLQIKLKQLYAIKRLSLECSEMFMKAITNIEQELILLKNSNPEEFI